MRRWGGLFPLICELDNLRLAHCRARRGKRLCPDVVEFERQLEANLRELRCNLLAGTFLPGAYRRFTVHDPKERVISVAPYRDRVLHHAVMNVCEPVFDTYQIHDSYACRRGRGTYAALDRARGFSRRNPWYLKLDIRKYFDSIPHDRLKGALARRFKEGEVLELFERVIDSHCTATGRGLPIGNLTSQFLANHYLTAADHFVKERLRRRAYVRYMDDMVLWGDGPGRLAVLGRRLTEFIGRELGLEVKSWCLNRVAGGLPFLGHIVNAEGAVALSSRSKRRYRARMVDACGRLECGDWDQDEFAAHAQALVAVTEYADEKDYRKTVAKQLELSGIIPWARTA